MNLIERIQNEINSDDADTDAQSELLAQAWEQADAGGRNLLDRAFTALCGYGLTTLIAKGGN